MSLRNYIDKVKRYFWFSKVETTSFILVVVFLAVVASWTQWGTERFDFAAGLKSWLYAVLLVGIAVFVHHASQRLMALSLGFYAEQKFWWHGLIISLILLLLTNGKIRFLGATSTIIHLLPVHRLGAFRYGPNLSSIMKVSLAGPVGNIVFSAIVKSLEWAGILPHVFAERLFIMNLSFAAWNLLPIPPLDGSKLLFYSRLTYILMASSLISYAVFVYWLGVYSYIYAGLIGIGAWLAWYIFFEKGLK